MSENPGGSNPIVVDPEKYDLDASWEKDISTWMRVALKVLSRVPHQPATIAILAIVAIVAMLWKIEACPQDAVIMIFAMGFISMIGVSVEWIASHHDDNQRRKGAAEPRHAP